MLTTCRAYRTQSSKPHSLVPMCQTPAKSAIVEHLIRSGHKYGRLCFNSLSAPQSFAMASSSSHQGNYQLTKRWSFEQDRNEQPSLARSSHTDSDSETGRHQSIDDRSHNPSSKRTTSTSTTHLTRSSPGKTRPGGWGFLHGIPIGGPLK